MNTLKQIASRAMVFALALAVLVPALIVAGDNNAVQAEKLATVYLTKKELGTQPRPRLLIHVLLLHPG